MLLRTVVTPERASCCTLALRVAAPKSWPLITPVMLPRPPRGSPGRKEESDCDSIHLCTLSVSSYCTHFPKEQSEAQRGEVTCPRAPS